MSEPLDHSIRYRADIDGMRAIAVLGVVLYHAGVPHLDGGYVGVDVFFVISGFLITRLLLAGAGRGLWPALRDFYLRRARRILPALLVMMVISTAVAVWTLLPSDLIRYGKFVTLTSRLLANVAAWYEGSYFMVGATKAPLLHLWSIAVEEQFYLLYPLALFGILLTRTRLLPWLGLLCAISLAVWLWGWVYHPRATYYFPLTRAWQLLAGALLATGAARYTLGRASAEWLAAAGLATILACFILCDENSAQVGWIAVIPTLAAMALVVAGESGEAKVSRVLASRPLVFVGLISYSLYLWHAPLFTFARYWNVVPFGALQTSALIVIAFALAVMSWAWIETPVRSRRVLRSNGPMIALAVFVSAGLWYAGHEMMRSNGWPRRMDARASAILDAAQPDDDLTYRCFILPSAAIAAGELCHYGPVDSHLPKVVLWGDSHAGRSRRAFERLAYERGFELYFAGHMGCRPLIGVRSPGTHFKLANLCDDFNVAMTEGVKQLKPALVIFDAYWGLPDGDLVATPQLHVQGPESLFIRGMRETLARTGGRPACVVLATPVMGLHVPYAMVMTQRRGGDPSFIAVSREDALKESAAVDGDLRLLAASGAMRVVDPKVILCPGKTCLFRDSEGRPTFYDNNHLSVPGAMLVTPELARCLEGVISP